MEVGFPGRMSLDQTSTRTARPGREAGNNGDRLGVLRSCRLFDPTPTPLLAELAECCFERVLTHDAVLWSEGDESCAVFVISSGMLRATLTSPAGDVFVLDLYGPGDLAGQVDVLDGGQRSATATARGRTTLLGMPNASLRTLLGTHPPTLVHWSDAMAVVVRRTREGMRDLVFLDLVGRLAKLVLRVTGDGAHAPATPLNQHELATMLGARRQSVNAALATLRRQDAVVVDRGAVVAVLDVPRLRALARG